MQTEGKEILKGGGIKKRKREEGKLPLKKKKKVRINCAVAKLSPKIASKLFPLKKKFSSNLSKCQFCYVSKIILRMVVVYFFLYHMIEPIMFFEDYFIACVFVCLCGFVYKEKR